MPLPSSPMISSRRLVLCQHWAISIAPQSVWIHFILPWKVPKGPITTRIITGHNVSFLLQEWQPQNLSCPPPKRQGWYRLERVLVNIVALGKALFCFLARLAFLSGIFFFFLLLLLEMQRNSDKSKNQTKRQKTRVIYLLGLIVTVAKVPKGRALTVAKQVRAPSLAAT